MTLRSLRSLPPHVPAPDLPSEPGVLALFGWSERWRALFSSLEKRGHRAGRVIAEHRGEYSVITEGGEIRAQVSGRLRLGIKRGEEGRPAVGDWVAVDELAGVERGIIHAVLPRVTKLSRKAAGREEVEQVMAVNLDVVFVVSSLDQDLNERRLERYLAVVRESGADPVVTLTKADLCPDPKAAVARVSRLAAGVPVHAVSALTGRGMSQLDPYLTPGSTLALIGSSGVGKSTLVNRWLGYERQTVRALREDGKGRHTTTHRELVQLPSGALVIDTPGMRELAVWAEEEDVADAVGETFADVAELARACRFRDCRHQGEPDCAVQLAVQQGNLPAERVQSYLKLLKEVEVAERRVGERALAEAKRADQRLSRASRSFYKERGRQGR